MACNRLFLLFLFFFAGFHAAFAADGDLRKSSRKSPETLVYKMSPKQMREIYLNDKPADQDMLQTLVARYEDEIPELPRGNYMKVTAYGSKLEWEPHTVDDLDYEILRSDRLVIFLFDSQGNAITDARLRSADGGFTLDRATKTYVFNGRFRQAEATVEIEHRGVVHYVDINGPKPKVGFVKRTWEKIFPDKKKKKSKSSYRRPAAKPAQKPQKGDGFVVFSKPRYKLGDTLRFKAFVTDGKGRPYKGESLVRLVNNSRSKTLALDTTLTTLKPYRPGMYEWKLALNDSLRLKLDMNYSLVVKPGGGKIPQVSGSFRYEEYELKKTEFSATLEKDSYIRGDSIKLRLSAKDENGLGLYGGRVEVTVCPVWVGTNRLGVMYSSNYKDFRLYGQTAFIPNLLWEHTENMNGASEKEILIPDSIFPASASLRVTVKCVFLSADNEKREKTNTLTIKDEESRIAWEMEKGMMTVKELKNGISQQVRAVLKTYGHDEEVTAAYTVTLPYTFPVSWTDAKYAISTEASGFEIYRFDKYRKTDLWNSLMEYDYYRSSDSVVFRVGSPARIPFWYKIYRNDHIVEKGYATELDYAVRDRGGNAYMAQLSFIAGGDERTKTLHLPYYEKSVSVDVATPRFVSPGDTAEIVVSVTDRKDKPLRGADVTAWAVTSKFNASMPRLNVYSKSKRVPAIKTLRYRHEAAEEEKSTHLDWLRWNKSMGLDTIEYYRFLYPAPVYEYSEPAADTLSLISPYVVIDGDVQQTLALWIDGQPHYYHGAEGKNPYVFAVGPGSHTIEIRTEAGKVTVRGVKAPRGARSVASFEGSAGSRTARLFGQEVNIEVESYMPHDPSYGKLTAMERTSLMRRMITVENRESLILLPDGRNSNAVKLPYYLEYNGRYYLLNSMGMGSIRQSSYRTTRSLPPTLAGPFPQDPDPGKNVARVYAGDEEIGSFTVKGGNQYSFYGDSWQQDIWERNLVDKPLRAETQRYYFQNLVTPESMRADFDRSFLISLQRLNNEISAYKKTYGTPVVKSTAKERCDVLLLIPEDKSREFPDKSKPVLIMVSDPGESGGRSLYYGGTRFFSDIQQGEHILTLVFPDTTSLSASVTARAGGLTAIRMEPKKTAPSRDSLALEAFRMLASMSKRMDAVPLTGNKNLKPEGERRQEQYGTLVSPADRPRLITGRVVDAVTKEPLPFAAVTIEGTKIGRSTANDGGFGIVAPSLKNATILVRYMGYEDYSTKVKPGTSMGDIYMTPVAGKIETVVVTGYGNILQEAYTGSATVVGKEQLMERPVASFEDALRGLSVGTLTSSSGQPGEESVVRLRGIGSMEADKQPLYVINGVICDPTADPENNPLNSLNPSDIANMTVLKDSEAIALYGSRGARGVIVITLKEGVAFTPPIPAFDASFQEFDANPAMRRSFHDDAFWRPRLITGRDGKVAFSVAYPDDITRWDANFIAVAGRKKTGSKRLSVNAYKMLNAQLSVPRFAVRGDSLSAVGLVTNHTADTVMVMVAAGVGERKDRRTVGIAKSYTETIPVIAAQGDSVKVSFAMSRRGGGGDGEERTIPIYERGSLQTHGEFRVIGDGAVHTFETDPALGTVIFNAEASALEVFLDEIEKVKNYPYMCNEQMASKIKALICKKRILSALGREFKDEKPLKNLVEQLWGNRNDDGLWGWWGKGETRMWISQTVIEALAIASAEGYETPGSQNLWRFIANDLDENISKISSQRIISDAGMLSRRRSVTEMFRQLVLLKQLDAPLDYYAYYRQIDKMRGGSVTEALASLSALARTGEVGKKEAGAVLSHSSRTMMGSLYWSDKTLGGAYLYIPYAGDVENTLAAYEVLSRVEGYEKEAEQARQYFFERRRDGSWRNTYESGRILETILPGMITAGTSLTVEGSVNGEKITEFPFRKEFPAGTKVEFSKKGVPPAFVAVYQQAWNPEPEAASNGFTVRSTFRENADTVATLTAGVAAVMTVSVDVISDSEYVMIEIPIPAGCSYESKSQTWWRETHREYFKEKVVVFCDRLRAGRHTFNVELIPRFTGRYHINPPKAELMYFPTFYGRGEMKTTEIK